MSVLIRGMEMPKNCWECALSDIDDDFGRCCLFSGIACLTIGRQDNCPLVEIPTPHGRLIDADALTVELMDSDLDHLQRDDWKEVIQIVADAPTITSEPHWIPWTGECDLMDNEEVLVCQKDGQIRHAMFYDFGGKKKFVTWEEGITIYDVVAYMPLPEPFKGVTE